MINKAKKQDYEHTHTHILCQSIKSSSGALCDCCGCRFFAIFYSFVFLLLYLSLLFLSLINVIAIRIDVVRCCVQFWFFVENGCGVGDGRAIINKPIDKTSIEMCFCSCACLKSIRILFL